MYKRYRWFLLFTVLISYHDHGFACPNIQFERLNCVGADGGEFSLFDYRLSSQGSSQRLSFYAYDMDFVFSLPFVDSVSSSITTKMFCRNGVLISQETFQGYQDHQVYKVEVVTSFFKSGLRIRGRSLVTKCDFPHGCAEGKHYLHHFIDQDTYCQSE